MSDWEPSIYNDDPLVNAILNVAASINRQAEATETLLYGLKYGKMEGLSVAEAIEMSMKGVSGAIDAIADRLDDRD